MRKQEIQLRDNEIALKANQETGEITEVKPRPNNIPEGMSKLDYKQFSIVNDAAIKILASIFSNEEMGIIYKMIQKADFNSNALIPLSNETSVRDLATEFNIGKNRVNAVFTKLFTFGVYMHIEVYEDTLSEYWVLNPNISWKGRLKSDSIFYHFRNTHVSKLLS